MLRRAVQVKSGPSPIGPAPAGSAKLACEAERNWLTSFREASFLITKKLACQACEDHHDGH